jgi:hypothetical protein
VNLNNEYNFLFKRQQEKKKKKIQLYNFLLYVYACLEIFSKKKSLYISIKFIKICLFIQR